GRGPPEARGGDRESVGGAAQGQDRQGHAAAGAGHRADQAGGPQHGLDRLRDADHRRHGPQHGNRRSLARFCEPQIVAGLGPADRGEHKRNPGDDMATVTQKKVSKRYDAAAAKIAPDKQYSFEEAVALLKSMPAAKFDQSVDLSFRLGVDPKHADQMVRGAVVMPHGIGKSVRVAVFAKGEKEREAREAGADVIGAEDLVERVQGGWMEFDTAVATPDLMGQVGRLGKVLGPRGLMPNPKLGTVTFDVGRAVREAKAGKVEFRVDK